MDIQDIISKRRRQLNLTLEDVGSAVGVSKTTVQRWESGKIGNLRRDKIAKLAAVLKVDAVDLVSDDNSATLDSVIPITALIPIYGSIPAGEPAFAEQYILGYAPIYNKNPNDYFGLKVHGTSMIGAKIPNGSTVIVQRQPCAEDGDIVACRINGDEATLKRFKRQGDTILLLPENPEYEPRIVPMKAFENGEAEILGVVRQIMIDI